MKRLLPSRFRCVALTFTLCTLTWLLLTLWAFEFKVKGVDKIWAHDNNLELRDFRRSVEKLRGDNLATADADFTDTRHWESTTAEEKLERNLTTVTQSETDYQFHEFQSAVLEESRRLNILLKRPNKALFPKVTTLSCPKLWASGVDAEYLSEAQNATRNCTRTSRDYLALTLNCTSYFLDTGFRLADVSEEELSFPLAFSLLVYKEVEQVERLLRAIYRPHNVYCVHVDRKSDEAFQSSLRLIVGCLPNVYMLERSIDVRWGEYTVLEPELECMRRLWSHSARWRYFINLTGQEFPLKTNKELVTIFKAFNGANDITGTHDAEFHFRWRKFLPAPYDLQISKGSVLMVASRGYVDYVVNSRVSRELQKWVRETQVPDETFFSTLNHNAKLGVPGSYTGDLDTRNHNAAFARYKVWQFENETLCRGKFVRWVCHFGVGDLPRLTSAPELIANKFSYDFQPLAYDCLEEWYFHKVKLENSGNPLQLSVALYEQSDMVQNLYTGPVQVW